MNCLRTVISQHTVFILSGLVSIGVAIFYLSVAQTRLSNANFGSDGGDFLAAILTRGIPHPTGYPTYTLLGILFQLFPSGTPVFRGALESMLTAALGAGLLTGWVGYFNRRKIYCSAYWSSGRGKRVGSSTVTLFASGDR